MLPRLLLDTHVLLRWLGDARKLSGEQTRVIDAALRNAEPLAVSAISLLEIAVLAGDGKLRIKPVWKNSSRISQVIRFSEFFR